MSYAISTQLSQMQIRFKLIQTKQKSCKKKNGKKNKKKKEGRRKLVSILIQLGNTRIISSETFQLPIRSHAMCQMGNQSGKNWKNRGRDHPQFFFARFVTIRKCQRAEPWCRRSGFNGPAVVSPVKIDELRDNALVQSARY